MVDANERKKGAILSYISIIIVTLVQLLYTPLLVRKLGQNEYGLYSLLSSIIGYLTVLDFGFGNAIIVYTSKYRSQGKIEEEKKLHGMFLIIFSIIGAIAAIIGFILFLNVNLFFGDTMTEVELTKAKIMMLILTFNLAITFPFSIYSSIITAYEKFTFKKIISILGTLLKPILMIPLLFLNFKAITMTVVITIINILILLLNFLYCRKKLKIDIHFYGFDWKLFKEILSYSIFIFIAVIVDQINWNVDKFILGAVSGTIAVSVYSIASQFNSLFVNLSSALSGVFLPKLSKMAGKGESNKKLTDEMIKIGRIQAYIIFFMLVSFIIFGEKFIILWAGKEYKQSYIIALILIIPLCFELVQNLALNIAQALGKHKFRAINTLIMALGNIIISYFLAKRYGPIGSAVGTALSFIICNVMLMNIYYYKKLKLDVIKFWKNISKIITINFIPIILLLVIMKFIKISGFLGIFVYGALFGILYCINSYFLVMNTYEKELVVNLINKFKIIKL